MSTESSGSGQQSGSEIGRPRLAVFFCVSRVSALGGGFNRSTQHLVFLIGWLVNYKRLASGTDAVQFPSEMHATNSPVAPNRP